MISEEHIQLESSSVPVSSDGFHEAQHVQTALEPPVLEPAVSQPMTNSHTAEVPAQTLERDLSATVEEVELTTVLDRTLIEERNSADASTKKHAEVPMPKTSGGGHRPLIPKSSYYFGPPSPDSAYGTAPTGHIGVHHPREILRVERDYTGGELIQFAPIYPLELEGRITPTQFLESINSINELLISAHTLRHSFLDNVIGIFSLQISKLFLTTHFEREMMRLQHLIDDLNIGTYNPVGLNILWPRNVAFLYLEIEYYLLAFNDDDLHTGSLMDAYTDTSFWDSTPAFNQLPDSDFFALLQKQFPPTADPFVGVNPQNLTTYPLPILTPSSEESSPSPPNSNQEVSNDDVTEAPLKRKASGEEFSDVPNQKTQHTDKKSDGNPARRRSAANAPKDEGRLMKRKEQNRAAQRAFRERKEKHVKDLEDKVAELEAKNEQAQNENENLRDLLTRLRGENMALKQSSFTFTAPKIPIKSLDTAELPKFASGSSVIASPVASPKTTNPLDWSSLSTFDPAMLNLLDDSVSQPTATDGAMQLDFGFGNNTGLASNAPYTTIASNPAFMSFTSTFDSPSNTSAPASNSFVSSPFNFDMNSLSTWSSPPTASQDTQLDDLFTGYLSTMNPTDFSMQSQSSASVSPVSHQIASPFRSGTSQTSSSSPPSAAPQASKSSPDCASSGREKALCRNKMLEVISSGGPSPFATGTLQGTPENATVIPCVEGAAFPKTIKSEKNIEVMTAWKSITSDPKFKDVDIGSLCSEFTSKARCDGSRVVLEPQGVNSILETLSNKQ